MKEFNREWAQRSWPARLKPTCFNEDWEARQLLRNLARVKNPETLFGVLKSELSSVMERISPVWQAIVDKGLLELVSDGLLELSNRFSKGFNIGAVNEELTFSEQFSDPLGNPLQQKIYEHWHDISCKSYSDNCRDFATYLLDIQQGYVVDHEDFLLKVFGLEQIDEIKARKSQIEALKATTRDMAKRNFTIILQIEKMREEVQTLCKWLQWVVLQVDRDMLSTSTHAGFRLALTTRLKWLSNAMNRRNLCISHLTRNELMLRIAALDEMDDLSYLRENLPSCPFLDKVTQNGGTFS